MVCCDEIDHKNIAVQICTWGRKRIPFKYRHVCTYIHTYTVVFIQKEAWLFITYKWDLTWHFCESFLHFTWAFTYFTALNPCIYSGPGIDISPAFIWTNTYGIHLCNPPGPDPFRLHLREVMIVGDHICHYGLLIRWVNINILNTYLHIHNILERCYSIMGVSLGLHCACGLCNMNCICVVRSK